MSTLPPDNGVSKLLSATDNVVIRNHKYQHVRLTTDLGSETEVRECGRLNKSIKDLKEIAEKVRKAGGTQP